MQESQLLRAADRMRANIGPDVVQDSARLRALTPREILLLEKLGNYADDWFGVQVTEAFDPHRVRHCQFRGSVILGRFSGSVVLPEGITLPSGVYHSTL